MFQRLSVLLSTVAVVAMVSGGARADLIGWYELDDTTTSAVNATVGPDGAYENFDVSDLAQAGSPGDSASPDNSVLFDASSQRITLGASGGVLSGLSQATVSMWVQFSSVSDDDTLLSIGSFSSGVPLIVWRDESMSAGGGGADGFVVLMGTTRAQSNAGALTSTSEWYHLAFTYQGGVSNGLRLYINGVDVTTTTSGTLPGTIGASGTDPLAAGQVSNAINNDKQFAGLMDELAFYNEILTPYQIASLANGYSPTSVIPEPASAALLGSLMLMGLSRRRRA
ncbi:LamG domain-containing protein [Planctomycetales bacterium ZRK34]|nr:LamG domain-containing protein [Planctomycetales bacterium ZRK34]